MTSIRRLFLTLLAGLIVLGAGIMPTHADGPGAADDGVLSVLVATNEPYGTYHVKSMVDEVEEQGGRMALVAPDLDHVGDDSAVDVVTLDEAADWGADLLVVNGATEWPAAVVNELDTLPVVASSLAYLQPEEAEFAADIRERLVGATAQSADEADVFGAHLGVDPSQIEIVGNPSLDGLAPRDPRPGTVLIATSVTYPDETGGAAPGTELLLETAKELQAQGRHVRVGLHPREDPVLWEGFEIAEEGTLAASATAEVVVGIPGSIFPQIAAVGTPLVAVMDPTMEIPDYLVALSAEASTVDEAVAAVGDAWRPRRAELESIVGPVGGSAERLWEAWAEAAESAPGVPGAGEGGPTPVPGDTDPSHDTPSPTSGSTSVGESEPTGQRGLPNTGI